jgi:hypothetical protein
MVGIVGKGAHIRGAYIQEMSRVGGAIGDPAAYCRILFDQCHPYVFGAAAQQMAGEQYATCAASHNDDMPCFVWVKAGTAGIILRWREFRQH